MTEEYSPDELITPKWLDEEFFKTVLKESAKDNFKALLKYTVGPATVKGDHYGSTMFRAIVEYSIFSKSAGKYENQETSMIIKTIPDEEGFKRDFLMKFSVFDVEIQIYRDVLPKFEEMLRKVGDKTILGPKLLYQSMTPRTVIVMEDVTKCGFSGIGQRFVTIDEFKLTADKLAKWYACSYIMEHENPGCFNKFTQGVFNIIFNMSEFADNPIFGAGLPRLIKLTKERSNLEKYTDKLEKILKKDFMKKVSNTYANCLKKSKLKILCHGDFHAKNLMFRFNSNSLAEEAMLLDFQTTIWNSMALDIIYSLHLMIDSDLSLEHEDEVIYYVFEKFQLGLKQLNFNGKLPKFSDLKSDLEQMIHVRLFLSSGLMLFNAMTKDKDINPDIVVNPNATEDDYMNLYRSKEYIKMIEPILKKFNNKGYLDMLLEEEDEE